MNLPPYPSQDLAKLVLGYLAEEQLMTAYDEFLQASPYLDAFGNEYDRIFMTSLKSILAEYRAVKIYVETCKPFQLRRKLFQCTSLLEMVKFLVQNIDISKILTQEQTKKCSVEKQKINDKTDCEVCRSLKLETCSCNTKSSKVSTGQSKDNYEESVLDSSVEATALSDLPGNHGTERKKTVCVSDSTTNDLNSINSLRLSNSNVPPEKNEITNSLLTSEKPIASQSNASPNDISSVKHGSLQIEQNQTQHIAAELNHILNQVHHQNQTSSEVHKHPMMMGGYNNFATGVSGGASEVMIVPDTSTTDKVYLQIPVSVESNVTNRDVVTKMKQTRTQYLLKVAHNNSTKPNEIVSITTTNNCPSIKPKPKQGNNKVKIISDVKVDSPFQSNDNSSKMPAVLKNATSTPLLKTQTIVINGTPVYKKSVDSKYNFTKDEIMAMPTIILAPVSGPPSSSVCTITSQSSCHPTAVAKSSQARSLSPLTIDISTEDEDNKSFNQETEQQNDKKEVLTDVNLPKTFDVTSASAPKDNTASGTSETNTPQGLPPIRKSSSTPRRTSHVRVLDFATPRRILHESMNKCITISNDVEVVSKITEVVHTDSVLQNNEKDKICESSKENDVEIKKVVSKKRNWDADLRALAIVTEVSEEVSHSPMLTSKSRSKTVRKKKENTTSSRKKGDEKQKKEKSCKKRTPKEKHAKTYIPEPSEEDLFKDKVSIPVKPTINIISGGDRDAAPVSTVPETDKSQNKSNEENINDTPEIERMSLQNEIGVKLNISDLLETPYKQALYDIQMETPRFLGPDIPDDPMSDIKIMNIPTPNFLNNPTPSSYSSRPTDYSSGGSYYKPDDQDYMRVTDDYICPVTSSVSRESIILDTSKNKETEISDNNEKNNDKSTRPVRQCTKNVSYYRQSNLNNKTKEVDSDMTDCSFCENTTVKETKIINNTKENKSKSQNKSDKKVSTKKRKTPKKEVSKSFMKIKPRRPTPLKKDVSKNKRKTPESSKARKKLTKQEESTVGATPVIVSAPTKSRRKSSTPRKLHCTKTFNSESSGHDSPELLAKEKAKEDIPKSNLISMHDSDTEQLPLRWSDDGSQDVKSKEVEANLINESEDITKIQEYLKTAARDDDLSKEGCLHIDLVKRGFDLETAKIIERELLDTSPHTTQDFAVKSDIVIPAANTEPIVCVPETKSNVAVLESTLESNLSTSNNLQIVQDDNEEEEVEEFELSIHECNQESDNFFFHCHDDTKDVPKKELVILKDKFSMEVCLDDDLSIRLRATPFSLLLDQDPDEALLNYDERETEMAVRSISNMDKLYTPLKQTIKDQCYEIFDSTLTSLDTPLKAKSPKYREEVTVTEIVLEVESLEVREKVDTKKRKRAQSGNMSDESESKKVKPEAQYLLNSANIQNIDIESVLSKLHGP